jgi:hypothetical protein
MMPPDRKWENVKEALNATEKNKWLILREPIAAVAARSVRRFENHGAEVRV